MVTTGGEVTMEKINVDYDSKLINLDDSVCQYLYDLVKDKNARNSPARITAIAELFKVTREKFERRS